LNRVYIKVHGQWRYLYRAIDRSGAMFSEHRDMAAAKAFSKADTVRCAGSSVRDRLAAFAAPTTSCVTFSVPVPEPISKFPPITAGSTSFAAPQRF
jgi:hypothetical protein